MKTGMMSTWKVPCGAAIHAELTGRSRIEKGHDVTGFAPLEEVKTRKRTSYTL